VSSLGTKDLKAVLDIVHMVNDDRTEVEVSQQVLARLRALVGCDSTFYSHADFATGRLVSTTTQEPHVADFDHLPGFHTAFRQHPVFAAYCRHQLPLGTPAALTDLADVRALRRLPLYVDYHEPHGINDQLVCVLRCAGQQSSGLVFNRVYRGFSSRDRAIVDLIAPHLSQAVARRRRMSSQIAAVRSLGRHADQVNQGRARLSLLTPREREVAEYLVGGVTDREIGRSLAISPRTVQKHLESIYRKLHVGNRTSLIALIHQKDHTSPVASYPSATVPRSD
jgi:DNA-binding CsgD family transcriptional regulator